MTRSPWRLEEVDGGDEQYPVESRFAVRHTPPDKQDPSLQKLHFCDARFIVMVVDTSVMIILVMSWNTSTTAQV